jgi:hypothetical protein
MSALGVYLLLRDRFSASDFLLHRHFIRYPRLQFMNSLVGIHRCFGTLLLSLSAVKTA